MCIILSLGKTEIFIPRGVKAAPRDPARAEFEEGCVLMKAVFRGNTLCIAGKSAKSRAHFVRKTQKPDRAALLTEEKKKYHEQLQRPAHRRQLLSDQLLFPHAHRDDLHPRRGGEHLRRLLLALLPLLHRRQGLLRHGAQGAQLLEHRAAPARRAQDQRRQLHARGPRLPQEDRRAGLAGRHARREDEGSTA